MRACKSLTLKFQTIIVLMKIIYGSFFILFLLLPAWAADTVSIEEFKKLNQAERDKVLQQAPPEQKEELKRIDMHLELVEQNGGEAGQKAAKETYVLNARGVGYFEAIFNVQTQVWGFYVSSVLLASQNSGMPRERQASVGEKLLEEQNKIQKRLPVVHSLVFNMAASPQALELEKKVQKLTDQWVKRISQDGATSCPPITRKERMEMDKQADQIFEAIKTLPKLTPAQAQKEYDDFPEEKMRRRLL